MKSTRYKDNWDETYERFERWWLREPTDRPLMRVTAPRDTPLGDTPEPANPGPPFMYTDADYLIQRHRHRMERTYFGAEAFPEAEAAFGPGSLALYLGSKPIWHERTVWFKPCIESLESSPLPEFNPENRWLKRHLELHRRLQEAFGEDAWVSIPDLIESLDILSAMRDPMALLYDLMDRPLECHRWLRRINELYFPCYDLFYEMLKGADGSSVFIAFAIWGPGKVAKVQCDFAAMISPEQFAEFYIPYLAEQLKGLDRALFHLDGPSCIVHVDQLVALERLHAIQWVSGEGAPDNGDERWYPLYEKILGAGKGLEVYLRPERVEPLVKRFGARGVYIMTSVRTQREADELVERTRTLCRRPTGAERKAS